MANTDLTGTWQYLGLLFPEFDTWQRFPSPTNSGNATIRLTFYDDQNFTKITSKGYIRAVYLLPDTFYSPWRRIYPSPDRLILNFAIPQEILYTAETVPRYFEIMKRTIRLKPGWTIRDTNWSLAIESLELIALTEEQQALLEQALRLENVATVIRNLLNG